MQRKYGVSHCYHQKWHMGGKHKIKTVKMSKESLKSLWNWSHTRGDIFQLRYKRRTGLWIRWDRRVENDQVFTFTGAHWHHEYLLRYGNVKFFFNLICNKFWYSVEPFTVNGRVKKYIDSCFAILLLLLMAENIGSYKIYNEIR